MNTEFAKILGISVLLVFMAGFFASNSPAYAVNSHVASGSQFGGGPDVKYNDGLRINGKPFDISKHVQTIQTQTIYVNNPSDITLKIYNNANSKNLLHLIVYLNLKGPNPHPINSDTWIDYSKSNGVSIRDPTKIFKSITARTAYDSQFMYLTFHMVAQKPLATSHVIVRAWDTKLSMNEVYLLNAVKITYLPYQFK